MNMNKHTYKYIYTYIKILLWFSVNQTKNATRKKIQNTYVHVDYIIYIYFSIYLDVAQQARFKNYGF